MPGKNPHDRRDRPPMAMAMADAISFADASGRPRFEMVPGPGALQREDLDAAIASAYRRGRRDEAIERDRAHRDEVHRAELHAWDEGHNRGATDGWSALVDWIDERFGERLKALHEMGRERIEMIAEMRKAGSGGSDLAESTALQGLTDLTRDLRAAIEQHFPRPD